MSCLNVYKTRPQKRKKLVTHSHTQQASQVWSCLLLFLSDTGLVPDQCDSPYLITMSWITIPRVEYYTVLNATSTHVHVHNLLTVSAIRIVYVTTQTSQTKQVFHETVIDMWNHSYWKLKWWLQFINNGIEHEKNCLD